MPRRDHQRVIATEPTAPTDPYMGEYSALAEQFLKRRNNPVYSVGQGVAQLAGDLGEAYFLKKAGQQEKEKDKANNQALANAFNIASDTNLSKSKINHLSGNQQSLEQQIFSSPASPQERARHATRSVASVDPALANKNAPSILEMAKQFAPEEKEYLAPVAGTDAKGNPIMVRPEKSGPGFANMDGIAPPKPEILQPGVEDARVRVAREGRAVTNINMPTVEKEFDKGFGGQRGGDFAKMAKGYDDVRVKGPEQMYQLRTLQQVLEDPNVYQGTGGPTVNALKKAGKTLFGLDLEGVGAAELATSIGDQMAIEIAKDAELKPLSDSDLKFTRGMPPGLAKSREGNVLLAEFRIRLKQRDLELSELARQYEESTGKLDSGFSAVVRDYNEKNPLFNEGDFMRAKSIAESAPQQTPFAGMDAIFQEADAIAAAALGGR